MVLHLTSQHIIVRDTVRINEQAVALVDGDREETRPLRPAKVVPMRGVNTSLRKKAHENTSDLDRDFRW